MDLHDFDDVAQDYDYYLQAMAPGRDEEVAAFHLDLARQHGQQGIVDIGCGTGVVLLPLVEAGYRVVGVDLSSAMIDVLRQKLADLPGDVAARAQLLCANMTELHLDEPVSLAAIPGSGFMHLLTPEDQERALRAINACLVDGGVLTFNTNDPSYRVIADNAIGSNPEPELRTTFTNARGYKVELWNTTEFDMAQQRIEGIWSFKEFDEDGAVVAKRQRPLLMRWSFEPEIRHLLRLCGFEIVEAYSSYDKEPRQYGGWIIWVARKRA